MLPRRAGTDQRESSVGVVGGGVGWFVWDVTFYGKCACLPIRASVPWTASEVRDVVVVIGPGNKLFQGRFIAAIYDNPSMFEVLQWTMLNSAIALVGTAGLCDRPPNEFVLRSCASTPARCLTFPFFPGYFVAAFTIDQPWMGRWRMQSMPTQST